MKLRPDPSLRRLGLFDIEVLVREPNRVGDRDTDRRPGRDVADGERSERGAHLREKLRAAKLLRSR